jgi:short subunit dehydrogenase-like uncharacterized protein
MLYGCAALVLLCQSLILIYGAAGYTGRAVAERALAVGLSFIVAGRRSNALEALASRLGVLYRAFTVDGPEGVPPSAFEGVSTLINCAGPFAATAPPLLDACIARGVHYLDTSAEFNTFALVETLSERASKAGVMLLPGVSFVPTDCLAAHVAARVSQPRTLRIALQVGSAMSRGSVKSVGEIFSAGLMRRTAGVIVPTLHATPARFDFGAGEVDCAPMSLGEAFTAFRSTRVPTIEMYVSVLGGIMPEPTVVGSGSSASALPDGPTAAQRASQPSRTVAEVTAADGSIVRSVLDMVNGYSYTPLAAVEIARRILQGESKPGFQTPVTAFGVGFAQTIADTQIMDL